MILMERVVLGAGSDFPACVLRLPMVYGLHDKQRREWLRLKRILDGRPILMGGGSSWLWQRIFVLDAARAIVIALESPAAMGEVFNIYSGERGWEENIAESVALAPGESAGNG